MTFEELRSLSYDKMLEELTSTPDVTRDESGNINYYDGKHPITTDVNRADYTKPIYQKDANGNLVKNEQGQPVSTGTTTITRARIVMSYPKQMVTTKVAMIAGNGVELVDSSNSDEANENFNVFKDIFNNKIKMDSVIKEVIKTTAVETHCALMFFFKNADPKQGIKTKLLSYANGDEIHPYFDSDGDLIAFTRVYNDKIVKNDAVTEAEVTQIYFADKMIEQIGSDAPEEKPNPYGKIPIVYFDQVYPEFKDSKDLISNQEYCVSQLYEVNRRIGNPPVIMYGDVAEMPDPSADMKMFRIKTNEGIDGDKKQGDVKLLEASTAPESIKLQLTTIDKAIEQASWFDLSKLRELTKGNAASGYAMEIALTDAFAKRALQIGTYNDGIIRVISILKTMLEAGGYGKFEELEVNHYFKPLLPDDIVTLTDVLTSAVQGNITSQDNAVRNYPLNRNPSQIMDEINEVKPGNIQ